MTGKELGSWLQDPHRRVLVMGILNVTPDSFSDGGRFAEPAAALAAAIQMAEAGADLIDIGGESTRPGSQPVAAEEQIRRVIPVIRAIRRQLQIAISIDTTSAAVAEQAMDAGADLVNDISAGRDDPAMFPLIAKKQAPVVLMHMQETPATMHIKPVYQDVTSEVAHFLRERVAAAEACGIDARRIILDPGLGFGKTMEHDLRLLRDMRIFIGLGHPVLIGASRKRFIGAITGVAEPAQRVFGTAGAIAWAVANGVAMVRVHDVGPMVSVVRVVRAILSEKPAEFLM